MAEFEVWSDAGANRLYIQLVGFFREADVAPVMDRLNVELDNMKPGFDVITDISQFKPSSSAATDAMRAGGELVKQRGRRRAIRVTGGIIAGIMQFKRLLRGVFEEDESVRYASSIQEADSILDTWDE
jgi:hypothetical protein